jgi:cellulose synthase/poly-beta-1,6-N-acetylglucosamine synthase-like glycosyltransferase
MFQVFLLVICIPSVAILLLFTIRRIMFTLAMLLTHKEDKEARSDGQGQLPATLILVSCRDEASMIPVLCHGLSLLDYPAESFQVVLIDDGSTDNSGVLMEQEAARRAGWHVLKFPGSIGKASALNAALNRFSFGEIIYILDADHRPDAKVLRRAARYFFDLRVAAVTGFTQVLNPLASPSAFYSTVESYTNQLVTIRAKDRLGLAPALLGSNCAYRRQFLTACGGFRDGAFSEDSDLTVTFYRAGYKIRFAEDANSYQQVPQSVKGYLRQHIRWGRGLNDVAKGHSLKILRDNNLNLPLRLELLLFTAGYIDRLALISAVFLMILTFLLGNTLFPLLLGIILFSLVAPLAQIVALFIKERMSMSMWIRLPLVPIFFALDIFAAVRSMLDTLLNQPRLWAKTPREEIL